MARKKSKAGKGKAAATERKWPEEKLLSDSERLVQLKDIIDRSPAITFIWRVIPGEWPVEFVSDNVKEVLGYTADEFMSGRVSWPGITHPDDVPRLEAEVAGYRKEGKMEWSQKYRLITKSGEVRWFRNQNLALRDPKGDITHIQSIVLDETEHKSAEEALQKERDLSHMYLDIAGVMLAAIDTDGQITMINR